MTFKKRYLRLVHLLFIVLLLIQLLPDKLSGDTYAQYVVWFAVGVEILTLIVSTFIKKPIGLTLFVDIVSFIYGLLIAWTLATAKFNLLKPALFPPPGRVFWQLIGDYEKIITNIFSSVGIILQGYLLAAASAIILGLLLGSSERLGNVATYISKFLGAIPPIVYIPYGIALLPTFRSVSVFVIFLATFWPVLAGTMSGVMNVDKKTIDSAKVLNVGKITMLFSVILPASLQQIFIGCNQGLTVSFVLLTSAEMIGAQSGLGYYIKNYSDLGDYTRTLVGLIVIGIVIVVISFVFNSLKDNAYALAFPSFGPERRGAPIRAFTKLDKKPIGNRSEITRSNYSIFLDDTLFNEKSFRELKQNGIILLNTKKTFEDPRVITLDGDGIAARILGLPITNTILLGAFAAVSREITLEDINKAIRHA